MEPNANISLYIDSLNAVASFLAALLGGGALLYSMVTYTKSLKISHYNELDKTYNSLLRLALRYPYFVNPSEITTEDQHKKYNIYAFMVWNFLEAIYDKCLDDKVLKDTWLPIIEVEGSVHYNWFRREENKPKFKESFYQYITNLLEPK